MSTRNSESFGISWKFGRQARGPPGHPFQTSRHSVNQQLNTVRTVMSNRLNPTRMWVNLHESRPQESFYASAQARFTGQFVSFWTPRMTRRMLCAMTLSARNRLADELVEVQFRGI